MSLDRQRPSTSSLPGSARELVHSLRLDRGEERSGPRIPWLAVLAGAVVAVVLVALLLWGGGPPEGDPDAGGGRAATGTAAGSAATAGGAAGGSAGGSDDGAATGRRPLLTASGFLRAKHRVEVASRVTGRVVAVLAERGDEVREGQVLAHLDDDEEEAEVRRWRAALEGARAELDRLEAGARPEEVARLEAEMEAARAEADNAALQAQRMDRLFDEGVVDRQTRDDARARHRSAAGAARAVEEAWKLVRLGPRPEEVAEAAARVRAAEAALDLAEVRLGHTRIRSPLAGVVLERYVEVGEMVTTGFTSERGARQALFSIADVSQLLADLDVAEREIAAVQVGLPVEVRPEAFPEESFRGTVVRIAGHADRSRATVAVEVRLDEVDPRLRLDMGVQAMIYPRAD